MQEKIEEEHLTLSQALEEWLNRDEEQVDLQEIVNQLQ